MQVAVFNSVPDCSRGERTPLPMPLRTAQGQAVMMHTGAHRRLIIYPHALTVIVIAILFSGHATARLRFKVLCG